MPDEPITIFISYARTDNDFVDRLEADLQARNFRTWVDRGKLEGGQNWLDEIQKAIDRCQVLLVVLSPEAVVSKYVRMEYREAQRQNKLVIPLEYQPCPKVPMELNDIQWVNFKITYDQGLKDLLIAINPLGLTAIMPPTPSPVQRNRDITGRFNLKAEEPEANLVEPQPAPPPPEPDLNDLYREGITARAENDLERTAILWQQVLDRNRNFMNGTLASRMEKLKQELRPIRVQRLRDRAEHAHSEGVWGQEIGAWQALLGLEVQDTQAKERIPIAVHNQKYTLDYENAEQFVNEGMVQSAKTQLEMLWQDAPYYGDPAGLAKRIQMRVPASYEAEKIKHRKAEVAQKRRGLVKNIFFYLGPFHMLADPSSFWHPNSYPKRKRDTIAFIHSLFLLGCFGSLVSHYFYGSIIGLFVGIVVGISLWLFIL